MAILGYLPKLKKDPGLTFAVHFSYDFIINMFSINGQSFNIIPFFLPRYQKKCVIKFWLTRGKRREGGNKKFEYLENKIAF